MTEKEGESERETEKKKVVREKKGKSEFIPMPWFHKYIFESKVIS